MFDRKHRLVTQSFMIQLFGEKHCETVIGSLNHFPLQKHPNTLSKKCHRVRMKSTVREASLPRFLSELFHSLAVRSWASYFTSLCLDFLIEKTKLVIMALPQGLSLELNNLMRITI